MSLKALGRLAVVGALALFATGTAFAESVAMSGTVAGDNQTGKHPIMVTAGDQVKITLVQTPAEGAGCLPLHSLHMFVYESAKVKHGPSATTVACTQELLYMPGKDGTVDVVVHNYSKDPAVAVAYTLTIDGAKSGETAATTTAAATTTTMASTAATTTTTTASTTDSTLPGPAKSGFGRPR